MTELAALAGEPGLFGPPPPGGAPVRHRAPLLPPAQQLGKRQTKRPASYAEAADLDSYLDGSGVRQHRTIAATQASVCTEVQLAVHSMPCSSDVRLPNPIILLPHLPAPLLYTKTNCVLVAGRVGRGRGRDCSSGRRC